MFNTIKAKKFDLIWAFSAGELNKQINGLLSLNEGYELFGEWKVVNGIYYQAVICK